MTKFEVVISGNDYREAMKVMEAVLLKNHEEGAVQALTQIDEYTGQDATKVIMECAEDMDRDALYSKGFMVGITAMGHYFNLLEAEELETDIVEKLEAQFFQTVLANMELALGAESKTKEKIQEFKFAMDEGSQKQATAEPTADWKEPVIAARDELKKIYFSQMGNYIKTHKPYISANIMPNLKKMQFEFDNRIHGMNDLICFLDGIDKPAPGNLAWFKTTKDTIHFKRETEAIFDAELERRKQRGDKYVFEEQV